MSRVGSMEKREFAPVINAREFARLGEVIEGSLQISEFARLATVLGGRGGTLQYCLRGGIDKQGNSILILEFDTRVELTCQRCLQQFELPVVVRNRFRLFDTEPDWSAEAAEISQQAEDELVAGVALDVQALIEDEVLLILPLAPRHEQCEMAWGKRELQRESPFGILEQLQKSAGK